MPRIHRGPTQVEYGFFYGLYSPLPLEDRDELEELVKKGHSPEALKFAEFALAKPDVRVLGVENISCETTQERKCAADKTHVTSERSTRVIADATHSGWVHPFVWGHHLTIINHWLKTRIEKSGLTGFKCESLHELKPGNLACNENYQGQDLRLYFLPECPRDLSMKSLVDPPEENACPFCGVSPIVCPGCGDWNAVCKGCGKHLVTRNPKELKKHPFLIVDDDWLIDVSKWNGEDFVGDLVTRRVVDFLLSIHAEPFVAMPIRANTLNITPEKRKQLEDSKKLELLR